MEHNWADFFFEVLGHAIQTGLKMQWNMIYVKITTFEEKKNLRAPSTHVIDWIVW